MRACSLLAGRLHDIKFEDPLAEVPPVAFPADDLLVGHPQFRHGEALGHEVERDVSGVGQVSKCGAGIVDDCRVIERQPRQIGEREPGCISRICPGAQPLVICSHQGEIGDRYHPPPGIAVRCAVDAELLQEGVVDTSLLLQFAGRAFIQRLVRLEKATGKRPVAFEGAGTTPDAEKFQLVVHQREHRDIGCHGQLGRWLSGSGPLFVC